MDPEVVLRHYLLAKLRFRRLSGVRLARFQNRRAQTIVRHAFRHALFYKSRWLDCDLQDWRTLPIIDRGDMRSSFDTMLTVPVTRDQALAAAQAYEGGHGAWLPGLTAGESSGTTGTRGLFLLSEYEQAAWAGTILARLTHGLPLRPLRIALFLRAHNPLYDQVNRASIKIRYFTPTVDDTSLARQLEEYQPAMLVGPPSLLRRVARLTLLGRLALPVRRVVSAAELLDAIDRKFIESVFSVVVEQVYQCTEGFIAASCAYGSVHIQEDIVALQEEGVDENYGVVQPVITDLNRRVQPIIRFRQSDLLRIEQSSCRCGSKFRIIHSFEGRAEDTPLLAREDGSFGRVFPSEIGAALTACSEIQDYDLVQSRAGGLQLRLQLTPGSSVRGVAEKAENRLRTTLARFPDISLLVKDGIALPPAAEKRRRVRRDP